MKAKAPTPRPKHVPQRTCIACRTVNAKRGLIRIVRTPTGEVALDATGKRSGRGAYLCRTRSCWDTALQKKSLEHALKTAISPEDKTALQTYIETRPLSDSAPLDAAPPTDTGPPGGLAPP